MATYSDGLSQIRENIEWFLQSSKKDDTPTNKMGLSVDGIKERHPCRKT